MNLSDVHSRILIYNLEGKLIKEQFLFEPVSYDDFPGNGHRLDIFRPNNLMETYKFTTAKYKARIKGSTLVTTPKIMKATFENIKNAPEIIYVEDRFILGEIPYPSKGNNIMQYLINETDCLTKEWFEKKYFEPLKKLRSEISNGT